MAITPQRARLGRAVDIRVGDELVGPDNPFPIGALAAGSEVTLKGSTAQLGSERLTSLATATAMTPTAGATKARVYCEAGEVRVTDTGVAATTTTGIVVGEGTWADVWKPADGSIIQTAAGSIVTVVYY